MKNKMKIGKIGARLLTTPAKKIVDIVDNEVYEIFIETPTSNKIGEKRIVFLESTYIKGTALKWMIENKPHFKKGVHIKNIEKLILERINNEK